MTRFRNLLKPDPQSSPSEEQRRASAGLADAVRRSNLRWWRGSEPVRGDYLLLAVAPYSQYDLVLLDLLDERLDSDEPSVPVYVANLQEYESVDQLSADFPGVGQPHQTPLAAISRAGTFKQVALGKKAREMAAEALGLPADELSRKVMAEAPSSTNLPALPRMSPPAEGRQAGSMTDEQRRFLWQIYKESQAAGGPARERLPYTQAFAAIRGKLNARFETQFDDQELWSVLSDLDRHPDRRIQIGCVD